jgi:hypothetical protein
MTYKMQKLIERTIQTEPGVYPRVQPTDYDADVLLNEYGAPLLEEHGERILINQ